MRDVYWRRICSSRCRLPWLCAIAIVMVVGSGCGGPGNTPTKPSYRKVGCRGGACVKLIDVHPGTPTGLTVPIWIGGVSHTGTSEGYVITGHRAIVWVDVDNDGRVDVAEDTNGNGVLDPGEDLDGDGILDVAEPVIQDAVGVVTAPPPPNTAGAPAMPGTLTVPRPTNAAGAPISGTVKIRVRVQIEVSEFGGPPQPEEDIEREIDVFIP